MKPEKSEARFFTTSVLNSFHALMATGKDVKPGSKLIAVGVLVLATMIQGVGPACGDTVAGDSLSNINLSPNSFQPLALTANDMSAIRSLSDEDLTNFVGALAATPSIPYASLPTNEWGMVVGSTFYSLQHLGDWPPLPLNPMQCPVWQLSDCFVIDDLNVSYAATGTTVTTQQSAMTLTADDETSPPNPGDGGDGTTNTSALGGNPGIVIDYGTNLFIYGSVAAGGYLTAAASNTIEDVYYEIQSCTNLIQANWQTEGTFPGSELTNWTAFSVFQGQRTNLFVRLRSLIDTYEIGIPDWWQLYYFGEVGIDPDASAANDGFSNLQKFDMGLNPTNYYNPNGPPGFFGYLDATGTNAFIAWSPAPGPVINYSIQRGIFNSLSGLYTYSQVGTVSSNADFVEDIGAINNNATNDIYQLEAVYPGGSLSATDTWQVIWFGQYGTLGAPYGPPSPTNFYAYADTNAANVLLSWTPASSVATNCLIERGIFNTISNAYAYHQIATVSPTTNGFKVSNPFTNANNWSDSYAFIAVYPGGVHAPMAISPVNVGWTNGLASPASFYGYEDGIGTNYSTGTNLVLAWTPAAGAPASYVLFEGNTNSLETCAYGELATVNGVTTNFVVTNGFNNLYDAYAVFAVYTNGSLSQAAFWQSANGTPTPGNFIAYFDATGTNVWLSWIAPPGAITGYQVTRWDDDGEYFVYNVSSSATSFEDKNAVNYGVFDPFGTIYMISAIYPRSGASLTAWAMVGTLPTPTDLSAALDVTGKNVLVTWTVVPGAINYVVERGVFNPTSGNYSYSPIATVENGVTSYVDTGAITGANSYNNVYQVEAVFPGGVASGFVASSVSESSDVPLSNVYIAANSVRNGSGRWQIMFSGLPTNSPQTIQLTWGEGFLPFVLPLVQTNLSTTNLLAGGIFQLPDAIALALQSYGSVLTATAQLFGPNGEPGQIVNAGLFPYDAPYFLDGRRHMKQNLAFLLRAASINQLFYSTGNAGGNSEDDYSGQYNQTSTNFEEFSFLHHLEPNQEDLNYFELEDLWPFTANYELANYLVDTTWTNGLWNGPTPSVPYGETNFTFQPNFATNIPAPAILIPTGPFWILQPGFGSYLTDSSDWGVSSSVGNTKASLASGNNLFGLPYSNGYIVANTNSLLNYLILSLGGNVTEPPGYVIDDYASWCPAPTLSLVNYYFAPLLPPENGFTDVSGLSLPGEIDPKGGSNVQPFPVPIEDDFNVTNQTPPIIASVGQPTIIGGWAKYSVGTSGKFGYLGQYFVTNALLFSNGVVTTNTAGVLSPYGEFFPLQAGTAQFTTMPDIDTGTQGTGVVRIISMNVDANHDGTMDLSYAGPDQTSPSRPLRFWANDDQDAGDFGGNNGIPGQGAQGDGLQQDRSTVISTWPMLLASSYPNGNYSVHGRHDLVDFFPVYLNIGSLFQSNALSAGISATDTNWQFVLSQADSALRYAYTGLTPTNYMNFLQDTVTSSNLAYAPLVTISNSGAILPPSFVSAIATNNLGIILVEAAVPTIQPLVLTIYHGTNQIAQMQLYLSITGVEQMFRHKNLMLNPNDTAPGERLTDASVPNEPDTIDKNFVFLHGYNVNTNEARGVASDMYKQMYWSGSHAKFWAVTWEGADTKGSYPFGDQLTPNYHTNVGNAFLTAPNLANFIASLTNSGPVVAAAHSLGNMVVLSAISDWNAPISQFFMMDAAVPIEAIDPTAITNMMIISTWTAYSNRVFASDWYQLFPTNDARSTLFWNNRLGNLRNVNVYNFYSSGEEVLRTYPGDPPPGVVNMVGTQLTDFWPFGIPFGTYTWYWQEKGKGVCEQDWFLGSSHGGWRFPVNSYGDPNPVPPTTANALSNAVLQVTPVFTFGSYFDPILGPFPDLILTNSTGGSAYAQANRNRILSDAIPAMSLVAGANPIPKFTASDHNIDMMTLENGWSLGRTGNEVGKWHHSDFVQMAYTFTHQLFDTFVTTGNLK
jgi:hypothetical protein